MLIITWYNTCMDDDYWEAEMEEEMQIRERAEKMGIDLEQTDQLIREKGDAFDITDEDIDNLSDNSF